MSVWGFDGNGSFLSMGGIYLSIKPGTDPDKLLCKFRASSVQVPCKFRASSVQVSPRTTSGRCPFLSNSQTSLVFTVEFVGFVLGVPELL